MKKSFFVYYKAQIKELFSFVIPACMAHKNLKPLFYILLLLLNPIAMYLMYYYDEGKIKPDSNWYNKYKEGTK